MAEQQPEKVTFGGPGSKAGQFKGPVGVTVSNEGEIFVADRDNQRIQVFTLKGKFVSQFPTVVPKKRKNLSPRDVAMDGEGNLWVVGYTRSAEFAVQYTQDGGALRKTELQKREWGIQGVAVDTRTNRVLITQTLGHLTKRHGEILVLKQDGTLAGLPESRHLGMKHPRYITVDGEGRILVSDRDNNCGFVCNEDGQLLFKFGGEGQLKSPNGICTGVAGNIIVANGQDNLVKVFDNEGNFLKHIATGMQGPQAVAMAPQGQLVVTDSMKHSVSIFQNSESE